MNSFSKLMATFFLIILTYFYSSMNSFDYFHKNRNNSVNNYLVSVEKTKLHSVKWNSIDIEYGNLEGIAIWESNNEPIFGLAVIINPGKYSNRTDYNGKFNIILPYGKYKVDFYFLNHLLRTDFIDFHSSINNKIYKIPDLPNQTSLEVKSAF